MFRTGWTQFREAQNPFWTETENVEMMTRTFVRPDFSNLVGTVTGLSLSELQELDEVLFDILYPTLTLADA